MERQLQSKKALTVREGDNIVDFVDLGGESSPQKKHKQTHGITFEKRGELKSEILIQRNRKENAMRMRSEMLHELYKDQNKGIPFDDEIGQDRGCSRACEAANCAIY